MTRQDFDNLIGPVLAFYGRPRDEEEVAHLVDYLNALYRAVSRTEAPQFELVVQEVVTELSPLKKPVPSQFLTAYDRLKTRFRWDQADHMQSDSHRMTPEQSEAWCQSEALLLSPTGAANVLETARRLGIKFSDAVEKILRDKTGVEHDLPQPANDVNSTSAHIAEGVET